MYKVLIADDEAFIKNLLKKTLESSDFPIEEVMTAEDGREALERALEFCPDIIITDIEMPFMNGLELIRQLQERGIKSKNIIISGYDEFEYAKKAISLGVTDYLLKPFNAEELFAIFSKIVQELDGQKQLKNNLQLLREQADKYRVLDRKKAMEALLAGQLDGESALEEAGISFRGKNCFITCILSVSNPVWDFRVQEQVEEFLKLIEFGYFSEQLQLYAVGLEDRKLAISFISRMESRAQFQKDVIAGIEKLAVSLKQYYDIVLYSSVGRVYSGAGMMKNSYEDALSAWKSVLEPHSHIWVYGEKKEEKTPEEPADSNRISHLKSCIKGAVCTGRREEVKELTQQLMHAYALNSGKGSEYALISIGELMYSLADDMEKRDMGRADQSGLLKLSQRTNTVSFFEIKEKLDAYLEECCRLVLENLSDNRSRAAIHLVQDYVGSHLDMRELSIEHMAEIAHFSVSYLRQVFKEVTGESFNEYLIRRRMERAADLLKNTSMKIQDIAERCGYENQRYFASSFKKFFGCTPTEYKTIVSGKND